MSRYTDTRTPFKTQLSGPQLRALEKMASTVSDFCSSAENNQSGLVERSPYRAAFRGVSAGVVAAAMLSNQAMADPDSTRSFIQPVDVRGYVSVDQVEDYPFEPLELTWGSDEFAVAQALRAYTEELYADH